MTAQYLSRVTEMPIELIETASDHTVPPALRNLLDVKRKVKLLDIKVLKIKPSLINDIVSAINTIGRATLPSDKNKPSQEAIDAALARTSVHARHLTPLFDRRTGARLGYSRAAWRNIPSLVRKGLKLTGTWALYKVERIKLTPEWQAIADRSPRLSPVRLLGHWAMLCGIQPSQFTDVHLPLFLDWLLTWKVRTNALKCYFAALGDWNKGARNQPDWPGRPVTVVTRLSSHYSVAAELWSPALRADIARILEALRQPDPDEEQAFEPISERTADTYEELLLRILSAYVVARKIDPGTITRVAEVLNPDAAKVALDFQLKWFQRTNPNVLRSSAVHGAAKLLATIADRCYQPRMPAETVLRLQKMARVRAPIRKGMTAKNRELLKKFDDEMLLARFLALPFEVAAEVLKRDTIRRVDGVQYMMAMGVAQSIEAPLRPEDQANMIVGRQIFRVTEGKKQILAIRLVSQKTKVDLDFELSGAVVGLYDTYVADIHKLICAEGNPYMYPGPGLDLKARGTLGPQMARFIEDRLGIRMSRQQFRHVIGYLYLKSHPGDYETVRQLLGHRDITTTMLFYASMDMRSASKKVSEFVAQKRRELAPLLRKRRKNLDRGDGE